MIYANFWQKNQIPRDFFCHFTEIPRDFRTSACQDSGESKTACRKGIRSLGTNRRSGAR